LPAPKNRKAASRDGINYKEESRLPRQLLLHCSNTVHPWTYAPKNRKAASRDGINYENVILNPPVLIWAMLMGDCIAAIAGFIYRWFEE